MADVGQVALKIWQRMGDTAWEPKGGRKHDQIVELINGGWLERCVMVNIGGRSDTGVEWTEAAKYAFTQFTALAELKDKLDAANGLLREWQAWDGKWIMADECWQGITPQITCELHDEYVATLAQKRDTLLKGTTP